MLHVGPHVIMLQKTIFLQNTVFVVFFIFIFIFCPNMAVKCLLCLCMVSYTLDMQIGSLQVLKIFI